MIFLHTPRHPPIHPFIPPSIQPSTFLRKLKMLKGRGSLNSNEGNQVFDIFFIIWEPWKDALNIYSYATSHAQWKKEGENWLKWRSSYIFHTKPHLLLISCTRQWKVLPSQICVFFTQKVLIIPTVRWCESCVFNKIFLVCDSWLTFEKLKSRGNQRSKTSKRNGFEIRLKFKNFFFYLTNSLRKYQHF